MHRDRLMDKNIVQILERRKTEQCAPATNRLLASSIAFRAINLEDIMDLDADESLQEGHVILGFTRNGGHLISYQCHIDIHHTYSLHWWRFDLFSPLRHVHCEELFRGENIEYDLHLAVCQTPCDDYVLVLGSAFWRQDCKPCFLTIIPSCNVEVAAHEKKCTIHVKYELLPPYPPFAPSLSLSLPGCVVINTGDSLVAFSYTTCVCKRVTHSVPCSIHTHQWFVSPSENVSLSPEYSSSPSQLLLPVEIYSGSQHWVLTSQRQKGCTECCQNSLDIELWLSNLLHTELEKQGVIFNSVTDYDLQLAEVSPDGRVVFVVTVELKACKPSCSLTESLTTLVVAVWDLHLGVAECIQFEKLQQSCPLHKVQNSTSIVAMKLHKKWNIPMSPWCCVRVLSNHTVFTGKSLYSLHHPLLPLAIWFNMD